MGLEPFAVVVVVVVGRPPQGSYSEPNNDEGVNLQPWEGENPEDDWSTTSLSKRKEMISIIQITMQQQRY